MSKKKKASNSVFKKNYDDKTKHLIELKMLWLSI